MTRKYTYFRKNRVRIAPDDGCALPCLIEKDAVCLLVVQSTVAWSDSEGSQCRKC